jgi:hypothetical protein
VKRKKDFQIEINQVFFTSNNFFHRTVFIGGSYTETLSLGEIYEPMRKLGAFAESLSLCRQKLCD